MEINKNIAIDEHEWDNDGPHYVLFLDIMGFKDRVSRTDHMELKQQLVDFVNEKRLLPLLKDEKGRLLRIARFSDSIIVGTNNCSKRSLNRLIKVGVVLMHHALECGFALKGSVAKGNLTFDDENGLIFGQSIIDAYLLEEELKFYGIAFHHTVEHDIEVFQKYPIRHGKNTIKLPVDDIQIHLKSGKSVHKTILYNKITRSLENKDYTDILKKHLRNIAKTVSGSPRIYIDNTISFFESTKENIQ